MDLGIEGIDDAAEIGVGASARVFRARQIKLDRDVAVKVLSTTDPDFVRRFDREARTLGRLSRHQGIVTLYEFGETTSGQPYLMLELCERSLLDDLQSAGTIAPYDACGIIRTVSSTVGAAHAEDVVHRDLKPANILVSQGGDYLITDFGISTVLGSTAGETSSIGFTAGYAAPETFDGGDGAGKPADVYALGATLFHLVHGKPPFTRPGGDQSVLALIQRIANEPIPDLRVDGVPDEICSVFEQAMSKDPTSRPDAASLAAELGGLLPTSEGPAIVLPAREPAGATIAVRPKLDGSGDSADPTGTGGAGLPVADAEPPETSADAASREPNGGERNTTGDHEQVVRRAPLIDERRPLLTRVLVPALVLLALATGVLWAVLRDAGTSDNEAGGSTAQPGEEPASPTLDRSADADGDSSGDASDEGGGNSGDEAQARAGGNDDGSSDEDAASDVDATADDGSPATTDAESGDTTSSTSSVTTALGSTSSATTTGSTRTTSTTGTTGGSTLEITSISGSSTVECWSGNQTYTAVTSGGVATSWNWNTEVGLQTPFNSGPNAVLSFDTDPGTYRITVTANGSASATKLITVTPGPGCTAEAPTPIIAGPAAVVCNTSHTYSVSASNGVPLTSFSWSAVGQSVSAPSSQSTTISFGPTPGPQQITATVNGSFPTVRTITVTVPEGGC